MEQQELHSLLMGMQNGTVTLEDRFLQTRNTLTIWSSYLPKGNDNMSTQKPAQEYL